MKPTQSVLGGAGHWVSRADLHFLQKPLERLLLAFPILLLRLREEPHTSPSTVLAFSYFKFGPQYFKRKSLFSPFKTPKIDQSWPKAHRILFKYPLEKVGNWQAIGFSVTLSHPQAVAMALSFPR